MVGDVPCGEKSSEVVEVTLCRGVCCGGGSSLVVMFLLVRGSLCTGCGSSLGVVFLLVRGTLGTGCGGGFGSILQVVGVTLVVSSCSCDSSWLTLVVWFSWHGIWAVVVGEDSYRGY